MEESRQLSALRPQSPPARRGPYMSDGNSRLVSPFASIGAQHRARFASASRGASPNDSEESSTGMPPVEEPKHDAEGSDQSDNNMEDDDTAEEESENGEAEDHEMGDGNAAVDDGAAGNEAVAPGSSTDDKPDEEPLKADSPWPDEPSREMVLRLAECSWLDERLASGQRPDPTARDAIMSAFSSLHFLDCLKGSALNSDNLGIDHAGHVFEIRPDGWVQRDYRRDFSDLRSTLRRKASDASATDEIRKQIRTYMDFDATGLLWESADVETENLVRLVRDMVRQNDFAVPKLKSIRAECEKAMAEMGKTVALANAVKQDLLDTGSTSLKRWKQLRSIGRRLGWSIGRMAVPEMPTPKDIDELVEDITQDSASYHRCFGYTLKLKWDLDSAIDDLSY